MSKDLFEEYERTRAEHLRLIDEFRRWGATEDEASGAYDFLDHLGPVAPSGPTERDVIDFLWQWVPRKVIGQENILDSIRAGVLRLLEFLAERGSVDRRAIARAADRDSFLRRVRSVSDGGEAWWDELVAALEETGMEPFREALPDGFAWGGIQGMIEARAYVLLKSRLAEAVRSGEVQPGRPGWRHQSALLQMRWLDTPQPEFEGETARRAIDREREEQAPEMPGLLTAMETMQDQGMFPGLPLSSQVDPAPAMLDEDDLVWSPSDQSFPVVEVPSDEDLVRAASQSPVLHHVTALLDVIGQGRPLTKKGFLTLADARTLLDRIGATDLMDPTSGGTSIRSSSELEPVEMTLRWARASGFVRVEHGKARPTRRGRAVGRDTLADWWALFDSFVWKLRWASRLWTRTGGRGSFWSEALAELTPRILEECYRQESLGVRAAARSVWWAIDRTYELDALTEQQARWLPEMVSSSLWYAVIRPLAALGALEAVEHGEPLDEWRLLRDDWLLDRDSDPVGGSDPQAVMDRIQRWQARREAREASREFRIAPIGRWAIRRLIAERHGIEPPAAGELADTAGSVEALLARAAELSFGPDEVAAEVRRFAARKGSDSTIRELARLLVRGGPGILAVQEALKAFDPKSAEPEVRAAGRADAVSPAGIVQCAIWLEEHGFSPLPVPSEREAVAEAAIWSVVAIARADGRAAVGEAIRRFPGEEMAGMVENMGRTKSPFAAEALEAIAWAPLPAKVRKAARTALHRVRTTTG